MAYDVPATRRRWPRAPETVRLEVPGPAPAPRAFDPVKMIPQRPRIYFYVGGVWVERSTWTRTA